MKKEPSVITPEKYIYKKRELICISILKVDDGQRSGAIVQKKDSQVTAPHID